MSTPQQTCNIYKINNIVSVSALYLYDIIECSYDKTFEEFRNEFSSLTLSGELFTVSYDEAITYLTQDPNYYNSSEALVLLNKEEVLYDKLIVKLPSAFVDCVKQYF